jgi:hypothetical protein
MMMIDCKTALTCAVLIALMLVAVVARIIFLPDRPIPASLLWALFLLPINPVLLVAGLYATGRRATAGAQVQPSHDSGKFFAIGGCACVLLIQGLQILQSLSLETPVWVGHSITIVNWAIVLLTIDQSAKLPWFERRGRRGELGPIYGPRYMRANVRIWLGCAVAVMAGFSALPGQAASYIALALLFPLVCSTALRHHYRGKWKLEQSTTSGMNP